MTEQGKKRPPTLAEQLVEVREAIRRLGAALGAPEPVRVRAGYVFVALTLYWLVQLVAVIVVLVTR